MPVLVVYVLLRVYWLICESAGSLLDALWEQAAAQVILWGLPCLFITMRWLGVSAVGAWRALGLGRGIGVGLLFGVAMTAPMAVAAILDSEGRAPSVQRLVADCVLGPVAESVLFSAFLLTHLRQRSKWPAAPAVIVCGILFALAHQTDVDMWLLGSLTRLMVVGNADALLQFMNIVVPAVLAVGTGGALFTWLFYRWGSLWPAIGLHAVMNFWWAIAEPGILSRSGRFHAATAATQVVSFGLAIIVTLYFTRRRAELAVAPPTT